MTELTKEQRYILQQANPHVTVMNGGNEVATKAAGVLVYLGLLTRIEEHNDRFIYALTDKGAEVLAETGA